MCFEKQLIIVYIIEPWSKGLVVLKALRECLDRSLRAHCFSLRAGKAYADAYAGLRTPGFGLCGVLIASPSLEINNWVLNVAQLVGIKQLERCVRNDMPLWSFRILKKDEKGRCPPVNKHGITWLWKGRWNQVLVMQDCRSHHEPGITGSHAEKSIKL